MVREVTEQHAGLTRFATSETSGHPVRAVSPCRFRSDEQVQEVGESGEHVGQAAQAPLVTDSCDSARSGPVLASTPARQRRMFHLVSRANRRS